MIRLVLYLAAVAALAAGAVWLAREPGSLIVVWRGWRMETTIGVAVLGGLAGSVVLAFVILALGALRRAARALASARRTRRLDNGLVAVGEGFAALSGGQLGIAARKAAAAEAMLGDHAVARVLRASVAAEQKDSAARRTAADALLARPETELAGLRERATLAADLGDPAAALDAARRALSRKDAPKWALDVVIGFDVERGAWAGAIEALESRIGRQHYTGDAKRKMLARLSAGHAAALLNAGDAAQAIDAARKAIDNGDDGARLILVKALTAAGKARKAAAEVERAWPHAAGPELFGAFRAIISNEAPLDLAKRTEKLAAIAPELAESRLAVAEASLRAGLWGQARNRLMPLLGDDAERGVQKRAALLMAELEQAERGDAAASLGWLRRAAAS